MAVVSHHGVKVVELRTPEDLAVVGLRKLLDSIEGRPVEPATILPVQLREGDTT